jgi:hypothetical protein
VRMERHEFGATPQCEQPCGTILMDAGEYRTEHDELIHLRKVASSAIALSESIWRSVLAHMEAEGFELHDGCELDDPKDCALYDVIATEVTRATGGKS